MNRLSVWVAQACAAEEEFGSNTPKADLGDRAGVLLPHTRRPRWRKRHISVLDFVTLLGQRRTGKRERRVIDIGCNDISSRLDHLPMDLVTTSNSFLDRRVLPTAGAAIY